MSVAMLAGERERLRHQIGNAKALLDALLSIAEAGLPCSETAQAVADASIRVVTFAARHDAVAHLLRQQNSTKGA